MIHTRGVNLVLGSGEEEAGPNCEHGQGHLLDPEENATGRKEWGRARPSEGPWGGDGEERRDQKPTGSSWIKRFSYHLPRGFC